MKKKFAKVMALACAMTMLFGVSAFAAPSTDSGNTDTAAAAAPAPSYSEGVTVGTVTVNGQEVTPVIAPVTNAQVTQAKEAAKSLVAASASVLKVFDITLPEGDYSAGVKVTIGVPDVVAGQKIAVLHQKTDGTWESLKVNEVANGSVTATFYSFSPVAIVSYETSDKMGSAFPMTLAIALLAFAGAAVCARKFALQ